MKGLHFRSKSERFGIDVMWLGVQAFYLLPTICIGKVPFVKYVDIRFLHLLVTIKVISEEYEER